jgi:hypothetical protein
MKLMDVLNSNQWGAIVETAEALVKAPKPMPFRDIEPDIPYSSDIEIIDCDGNNSDEEDKDKDAMELDDIKMVFGGDEPEDCDVEAY